MNFNPDAVEEIVETAAFYERRVPGLGHSFIDEVERIAGIVREQPQIGQTIDKIFRRIILARFPYSLIYSIEPVRIWIIAVTHQRRRPGYWREGIDC